MSYAITVLDFLHLSYSLIDAEESVYCHCSLRQDSMSVLRYCGQNKAEINDAFSMAQLPLWGTNLTTVLKRQLKISAVGNKAGYIYLEHLIFQLQLRGVFPPYLRFNISFRQTGISCSLLLVRTRVVIFLRLEIDSGKQVISFLWSHKVCKFSAL